MSEHFVIQELVPRSIYRQFEQRAWWFIAPKLIAVLDALRDDLGQPIIVNNWHLNGSYQYSGYRPPQCRIGARYSMHRMGLAADVKSPGLSPMDILEVIHSQPEKYLDLGLTTYENIKHTPTWLHLDCRPRLARQAPGEFLIVNP